MLMKFLEPIVILTAFTILKIIQLIIYCFYDYVGYDFYFNSGKTF